MDAFSYFLAHELGKTISEVEAMTGEEYLNWRSYFTARDAMENMKPVGRHG